MNALKGGNCCTCSCYHEGEPGYSSSADNRSANVNIGSGGHSTDGCNQYYECDENNEGWALPNPSEHLRA